MTPGPTSAAIRKGSEAAEFFGTAYGLAGEAYEGFQLGRGGASLDDTLLLIEPGKATELAAAEAAAAAARGEATPTPPAGSILPPAVGPQPAGVATAASPAGQPAAAAAASAPPRAFHGSVAVDAAVAKSQLVTLADEIIALLASDPAADVRVTLEVAASFPDGAGDQLKRAVSENATSLGFDTAAWE